MKRIGLPIAWLWLAGLLIVPAGCTYDRPTLPISIAEYDAMSQGRARVPEHTIVLLNRQRMMDSDRGESQRVESLALVNRLAGGDQAVERDVRALLDQPDTPAGLHVAAFELLRARNAPVAKPFTVFATQGYVFHPRDLHLLERLGGDAARPPLTRQQLVEAIGQTLAVREHVNIASAAPETDVLPPRRPVAGGAIDDFNTNLARLTQADLWNLMLIQEMLARPDVQRGLVVAARDDRADTTTAWGGLIVYDNDKGHADMIRYKTPAATGRSDFRHAFNPKAIEAGRDALARFQFHFEKADNTLRAGPTACDLDDAASFNAYGLILTTVHDGRDYCAHYYNPQGVIVSLGVYSLDDPPAK